MSIQSCSFCVQDVEKLWHWMCLRQVSMLCHVCLFLSYVHGVFNSPVATPHAGCSGLAEFSVTIYIGERELVCFVFLCRHPWSHFTTLLTRALFFRLFIYFRSMFGLSRSWYRWHGSKTIVRSRRSLDFLRSHFTRAHPFAWNIRFEVQSNGQFPFRE